MSKVVLIYDWAMKADEFKACVTAIEKLQNVRAVAVSNYWLEMGWASPENHNAQSNLIQNFWDKFNQSLNCYNNQYAEIFANRHLTFQFKRIKDEMVNALAYGDIFAVLLDILKPSAIIFAHEAFTLEKMLVGLSKKKGIPTASLFHGGLGPRVGFQGLCGDSDEILVWNNYDIDCLVSFGVDRARIKKIGCVRYENEYKQYKHHLHPYDHRTKAKAKAFIGLDKNKPLITLLTAQINTGFAAPCADPGKHREAIRHYISFVQSRPDLQFVIKAHPGYDYNELYSILRDYNLPNLFYDAGLKLDVVLKASDICFMVNYFTSAAIEAMLNRVPVIFLDNGIYPLRDWQDSLTDTNITRVSSFLELESKINDLLTRPEFKANTLLEADEILKNILGIEERSASDQLGLAITSMLNKKNVDEVEFDELSSRESLQYFLQSNDSQLAIKSLALLQKHNSRNIMYVLSYLFGAYSLSYFNVFRIFKQVKQMPIDMTWRDVKWHLFQSYILGIFNRSEKLRVIDIVRILTICIFNPNGFISSPGSFKLMVGKTLIRQLVGKHRHSSIMHLIKRVNFQQSNKIFIKKTK